MNRIVLVIIVFSIIGIGFYYYDKNKKEKAYSRFEKCYLLGIQNSFNLKDCSTSSKKRSEEIERYKQEYINNNYDNVYNILNDFNKKIKLYIDSNSESFNSLNYSIVGYEDVADWHIDYSTFNKFEKIAFSGHLKWWFQDNEENNIFEVTLPNNSWIFDNEEAEDSMSTYEFDIDLNDYDERVLGLIKDCVNKSYYCKLNVYGRVLDYKAHSPLIKPDFIKIFPVVLNKRVVEDMVLEKLGKQLRQRNNDFKKGIIKKEDIKKKFDEIYE